MKVTTTKSKNSESFYITMSYVNNEGKSTSKTIRKLGTLKELSQQLATDRDGVLAWAKEQARVETEKYKKQNQAKTVLIPFHADRLLDYHQQKLFKGGCPENCQRQDCTKPLARWLALVQHCLNISD